MTNANDRPMRLQRLAGHETVWDVLVVGGGITGAGVAREAARRGLRTAIVEQRDWAWGTSSRSSKMVHGGLRYIAQGDIKLTRDALRERERLLREAPGLVTRLGYWFGHRKRVFPGPLAFGILCAVYDKLAGIDDHRFAPRAEVLRKFPGLDDRRLVGATRYTDSTVDDARLVQRVLEEAVADGATAVNYVRAARLVRDGARVLGAVLVDEATGQELTVRARAVVNATGAWADHLREPITGQKKVRPLRGSHLVLPHERLPVDEALVFRHADDKRPVFIFPWEGRTIIGTTDLDHPHDLSLEAKIAAPEVDYLLRGTNAQFPSASITAADVISTWAGVRPVVASGKGLDPSQERREHVVWDDGGLVTVTGGKLTTFRLIALDVLAAAAKHVPGLDPCDDGGRTFRAVPGGSDEGRPDARPLPEAQRLRLLGRFGFLLPAFLGAMPRDELVPVEGTSTLLAELRWALRREQVVHLDDLLLRRTRLGNLLANGGAALEPTLGAMCAEELGWGQATFAAEWTRYQQLWSEHYGVPSRCLSVHTDADVLPAGTASRARASGR